MEDPVSNPFVAEPNSSPSASPALSRTPSNTSSAAPRRSSSLLTGASSSPPPTQRASFPDPSKEPRRGTSRLAGPQPKTDFCCDRDRQIARGDDISIIDAYKTTEGGKSSYITYVIRLGTYTTRRRYSAFLSLHQALQGLYPVLIIPPIPSKQSLADYAVKGQSKTKEDAATIARRKRLLEDFLRRVVRHPILGGDHVFHRFLEDGVSWNEVLHSPPVSLLPKNPLHAPSHNPTFQELEDDTDGASHSSTAYIAHHLLPNPSPTHPLHRPDQRFYESEQFTDKFQQHFQGNMEKVNRRVTKRWSEHATDMSELGAQWNGFSLSEKGELATAIEKVGQAVDTDYLSTTEMLKEWEVNVSEPIHTYTQFAQLIRSRLSFRHQKHVQYELVQEALDTQRDKLELLEAAEREARRIEDALERGGSFHQSAPTTPAKTGGAREEGEGGSPTGAGAGPGPEPSSPRPTPRRQGNSFGLLSAVKHSLSGMMDVDPEATRRANIGKTRDNISQLEDSLQASAQDLKYASTTLQADLDRFQRQKVADLKNLAIQLSTIHREWCRQNLEAWKTAQEAIREIPDHPNKVPQSQSAEAGPSGTQNMPDLASSMDRDLPPVPDRSPEASASQPLASPPMRSPPLMGGSSAMSGGQTGSMSGGLPMESPFKEAKSPLHEPEKAHSPSKSKSSTTSPVKSPSTLPIESPFMEETPTKAMSDLSVKDERKSSEGSNGPLGPL